MSSRFEAVDHSASFPASEQSKTGRQARRFVAFTARLAPVTKLTRGPI